MKPRRLAHLFLPLLLCTADIGHAAPTPETTAATTPEHHEEAYRQFCEALRKQAEAHTRDIAPAALIALNATNDEFCLESWMQRAATEGDAVANWYVGTQLIGNVLPEEKQAAHVRKGVALCKKAADKNFAPAMLDYATFLTHGIGVQRNPRAGQNMIINACKSGNFEARFYWLCENNKLNTIEDLQRKEVQSEIQRGNHDILFNLSNKCSSQEAMADMILRAAHMGNDKAMYSLFTGLRIPNTAAAGQFLLKAAECHNPMAISALAHHYYDPQPALDAVLKLGRNEATSATLFRLAAMMGDLRAHYSLAAFYYHGLGTTEQNYHKAYKHIEAAQRIRPNDAAILAAKGYMLLTGKGVTANPQQGFELICKASRQNDALARVIHAYVLYKGIGGIPQDAKTARNYLEDLATYGNDVCFIFLALMYEEGTEGLERNRQKADYYLEHGMRSLGQYGQSLYDFHKATGKGWQLNPFDFSELPPTTP